MAEVIAFPIPLISYPSRSTELDTAEYVLLVAVRRWVADHRSGTDPLPRLRQALGVAGAHDAAFSVDQLMCVVGRTARHPLAIHCPLCPGLSADETSLLHAASLAQAGEEEMAEAALRTALLSAQGAEFALGPLGGLAALFADARLFFRRRLVGVEAEVGLGVLGAGPVGLPARTVH